MPKSLPVCSGRFSGFTMLFALIVAAVLPQKAGAQSGKDLYGADVYWNATPNDVNNLLKSMKTQTDANFQMDIRTLKQVSEDPEKNPVLKVLRKFIPITPDYVRGKFFVRQNGLYATPLLLVLTVTYSSLYVRKRRTSGWIA